MLRREAAYWLARLQSGRDPEIQRKFDRWLSSSPRNSAAFDRVRRSYEQAGLLRQSPLTTPLAHEPAKPTQRRSLRYAIAAAIAAALLLPAAILLFGRDIAPVTRTEAVMLTSRIGEIRRVELSDGSRLTLDTDTRVEVEIGGARRRARLEQGRARFEIVPARKAFVVETRGAAVTAAIATLDVERSAAESRVTVLAGSAQVRRPGPRPEPALALTAGEGAIALATALTKNSPAEASDWTRGMLQFDGTPVADAVALANRYSTAHIIVGPGVAGLRVTGAFRAGDVAGFARALSAAFQLDLTGTADGDLLLAAPDPKPPGKKSVG